MLTFLRMKFLTLFTNTLIDWNKLGLCFSHHLLFAYIPQELSIQPLEMGYVKLPLFCQKQSAQGSIAGSNPTGAARKLWQFPLPHFASVFRKRHKSRRSLLSGVYARGSKRWADINDGRSRIRWTKGARFVPLPSVVSAVCIA